MDKNARTRKTFLAGNAGVSRLHALKLHRIINLNESQVFFIPETNTQIRLILVCEILRVRLMRNAFVPFIYF